MIKVTVLYNVTKSLPNGLPEDLQTTEAKTDAIVISRYLKKEGFDCELFEVKENNYQRLTSLKTDVCFNLCYGIGSLPNSEHKIPQILDFAKIPYTGSNSWAMLLTTNKAKAKKLFQKNGIPTPDFQITNHQEFKLQRNLKFPLIVKPLREDSSCGIRQKSVVKNKKELIAQVEQILSTYKQPVLLEEYIDGRELRVSILGNGKKATVLPITEISFQGSYKNKWKIVDFAAKWDHSADKDTPAHKARLDRKVYKKIATLALKVYRLCGCTDYADIDVRLKGDVFYFIEVNCNPGIAPTDGTARLAKAAGLTYGRYLKTIVLSALKRKKKP